MTNISASDYGISSDTGLLTESISASDYGISMDAGAITVVANTGLADGVAYDAGLLSVSTVIVISDRDDDFSTDTGTIAVSPVITIAAADSSISTDTGVFFIQLAGLANDIATDIASLTQATQLIASDYGISNDFTGIVAASNVINIASSDYGISTDVGNISESGVPLSGLTADSALDSGTLAPAMFASGLAQDIVGDTGALVINVNAYGSAVDLANDTGVLFDNVLLLYAYDNPFSTDAGLLNVTNIPLNPLTDLSFPTDTAALTLATQLSGTPTDIATDAGLAAVSSVIQIAGADYGISTDSGTTSEVEGGLSTLGADSALDNGTIAPYLYQTALAADLAIDNGSLSINVNAYAGGVDLAVDLGLLADTVSLTASDYVISTDAGLATVTSIPLSGLFDGVVSDSASLTGATQLTAADSSVATDSNSVVAVSSVTQIAAADFVGSTDGGNLSVVGVPLSALGADIALDAAIPFSTIPYPLYGLAADSATDGGTPAATFNINVAAGSQDLAIDASVIAVAVYAAGLAVDIALDSCSYPLCAVYAVTVKDPNSSDSIATDSGTLLTLISGFADGIANGGSALVNEFNVQLVGAFNDVTTDSGPGVVVATVFLSGLAQDNAIDLGLVTPSANINVQISGMASDQDTDWQFPLLEFNVQLAGLAVDVAEDHLGTLDLFDINIRGIAADSATDKGTTLQTLYISALDQFGLAAQLQQLQGVDLNTLSPYYAAYNSLTPLTWAQFLSNAYGTYQCCTWNLTTGGWNYNLGLCSAVLAQVLTSFGVCADTGKLSFSTTGATAVDVATDRGLLGPTTLIYGDLAYDIATNSGFLSTPVFAQDTITDDQSFPWDMAAINEIWPTNVFAQAQDLATDTNSGIFIPPNEYLLAYDSLCSGPDFALLTQAIAAAAGDVTFAIGFITEVNLFSIAVTETLPTSSGTILTGVSFSTSVTEPLPMGSGQFVQDWSVTEPNPVITGTFLTGSVFSVSVKEPLPVVSATITAPFIFSISVTEPLPTTTGALVSGNSWSASIGEPLPMIAASLISGNAWSASITEPLPFVPSVFATPGSFHGEVIDTAIGSGTFIPGSAPFSIFVTEPLPTIDVALLQHNSWSASLVETLSTIEALFTSPLDDYAPANDTLTTWVLHLLPMAVTQYTNTPFLGLGGIGQTGYAVMADGIYALRGNDDAGVPIDARFLTGTTDYGNDNLKTVLMVHAEVTGEVDMLVQFDGTTYEVPFAKECRARPGRGLRGNNIAYGVKNINGSAFSVQAIYPTIEISKKRHSYRS